MYWPSGPVWSCDTGPSGQFGAVILALRASFVLMYWPFGPVYSCYNGPSGQFGPDVLALRASFVLMSGKGARSGILPTFADKLFLRV